MKNLLKAFFIATDQNLVVHASSSGSPGSPDHTQATWYLKELLHPSTIQKKAKTRITPHRGNGNVRRVAVVRYWPRATHVRTLNPNHHCIVHYVRLLGWYSQIRP